MNYTETLKLNKPEAADPMRLEDFNHNADLIDAALAACGNCSIVTGSFTGTGEAGRTLELGFTPKAVILISQIDVNSGAALTIAATDFGVYLKEGSIGISSARCVEGGVYLGSSTNNQKNIPTTTSLSAEKGAPRKSREPLWCLGICFRLRIRPEPWRCRR